jgi:hypothetical protein
MSRQAGARARNNNDDGHNELFALQWGSNAYYVPRRATIFASSNLQRRYFDQTVSGICGGTGKGQQKVEALVSRFDIGPTAKADAEELLRPIYNSKECSNACSNC